MQLRINPGQIESYLNTFGGGGKPIGDAHENFGVGSKTSTLPWNRAGVVVVSWTPQDPEGSLVWLLRDPVSGEYGARKFEVDDFPSKCILLFSRKNETWIYQDARIFLIKNV